MAAAVQCAVLVAARFQILLSLDTQTRVSILSTGGELSLYAMSYADYIDSADPST